MIEGRAITVIKMTTILVSFTCVTLVFIPTGGIIGVIQGSLGLLICMEGYYAALEVNITRLLCYMLATLCYALYSLVIGILAIASPCTLDPECCYYNIKDEATRELLQGACFESYLQYGYVQLAAVYAGCVGVALPTTILLFFSCPAYKDLKKKVAAVNEDEKDLGHFLYSK